ncbi:nucleoside diphosphate kinase regulator [Microvirga brassicacearum]|uniref:Nucleoside diphosphate kinase regulator n=1 Tax=Microvirga brassicacearum TaxID=2580413 RepID=A0A5N3P5I4_9HYPH|nr:nucleoside diphosphate kinase regulator [Microvirga brassicacearum]KAB0265007.1 nucleoside diphosphate kinase regulator [Microvirga brassicacearum]
MSNASGRGKLPRIVVCEVERERLMRLAHAASAEMPAIAASLLSELERAKLVSGSLPPTIVRMNSRVRFAYDDGEKREAKLVYPDEADVAENWISVLTPIGAALIGLTQGQTIPWSGYDGQIHLLTVLHVDPPAE